MHTNGRNPPKLPSFRERWLIQSHTESSQLTSIFVKLGKMCSRQIPNFLSNPLSETKFEMDDWHHPRKGTIVLVVVSTKMALKKHENSVPRELRLKTDRPFAVVSDIAPATRPDKSATIHLGSTMYRHPAAQQPVWSRGRFSVVARCSKPSPRG